MKPAKELLISRQAIVSSRFLIECQLSKQLKQPPELLKVHKTVLCREKKVS